MGDRMSRSELTIGLEWLGNRSVMLIRGSVSADRVLKVDDD